MSSSPPPHPVSHPTAATELSSNTTRPPDKSYTDAAEDSSSMTSSDATINTLPTKPVAPGAIPNSGERRKKREDKRVEEVEEDHERNQAERKERRRRKRERREREGAEGEDGGERLIVKPPPRDAVMSPSPVSPKNQRHQRPISPVKASENGVGHGRESQAELEATPSKEEESLPPPLVESQSQSPDREREPSPIASDSDVLNHSPRRQRRKTDLVSYALGREITWAPLNIPLPRRLQTAAVLWHTVTITLFFSLFWFTLAIPFTWPLLIPYLVYIIVFATAHEDGSAPYKRWRLLRSLPLWKLYIAYFPIRLHRTVPLNPEKNYILAYHPHGIISHGAFGCFATDAAGWDELFPGITNTLLTLSSNFRIPFYREYLLALGLASVSRHSCENLLRGATPLLTRLVNPKSLTPKKGGRAITIVIGGARESLEALPGTMRLVVRRRRGFLKIAMREKAGVVPVLGFGENDLYEQFIPNTESWVHGFQMAVKRICGFTLPLMHARGVFNYDVGLMPYRRPVDVVVGSPLFWEGEGEPTEEGVRQFQKRYIRELERMWRENRDKFAKERKGELEIVE